MKRIIEKIKKYKQVAIYRHVNPDMDAFGSQIGLYLFLKEQCPNIRYVLMGEMDHPLLSLYHVSDFPTQLADEPTLGIVVDTANRERIDGDYSTCTELIKIDHHIIVDNYGDLNIVDEKASSCAQIITLMSEGYALPRLSARSLYIGIIGDSNRFLYRNTDARTFKAAAMLLTAGIDIEAIYNEMYVRPEKDLQVTRFILNNYIADGGVAYYILRDEDLKDLGISRQEGSNYVNTLANVEEFKIWVAVTENIKDHNVRVSIRSRYVPINKIANAFNGGGHALASGATLSSFDDLPRLIEALEDAIVAFDAQG